MNQPEPVQETPESAPPPTGGLGRFTEPYYFITTRRTFPDGSQVEDDEPGDYYRYPLRSWEVGAVLEWYEAAIGLQGEACPMTIESAHDAESGLRTLSLTDKQTGEIRFFFPRYAGMGAPCGLYTFSGHIYNWAQNSGRNLENLGEFVSQHAASGRPMTIFEASAAMDECCANLAADGLPLVRRWVNNRSGFVTHVERIEDVNAEMVSARYSEHTTLVIGYAPFEKKAPEPVKEERG